MSRPAANPSIMFAYLTLAAAFDHGYEVHYAPEGNYLAKRFQGGDSFAIVKACTSECHVPTSLQAPCFWSLYRAADGAVITNGASKSPMEAFRSIEAARINDLEKRSEQSGRHVFLMPQVG